MSKSITKSKKPGRPRKSQLPAHIGDLPANATAIDMTPSQEAAAFVGLLERAARDPKIDVSKMRELLDLKKEVLTEQRIAAFNADFMLAKMQMPRITKDGIVEYAVDKQKPDGPKKEAFRFARYETINAIIRPIEEAHGFSRSFTSTPRQGDGGGIIVKCTLLHREGHFKEAEIPVPLDSSGGKNNLQGYGSSFSYGKRYTTQMIWDIVTEGEDDDGSSAFAAAPIDDAQFLAIQNIIEGHSIDVKKFCAHLKVESIAAIPNKLYPKAMNDLKAYVKRLEEAKGK